MNDRRTRASCQLSQCSLLFVVASTRMVIVAILAQRIFAVPTRSTIANLVSNICSTMVAIDRDRSPAFSTRSRDL